MREGTNHIGDMRSESPDDVRNVASAPDDAAGVGESENGAREEGGTQKRPQPRDERGRFSTLVVGNPYARRVAHIREVVAWSLNDENAEAITVRMIERAKNGSESAARLVYQYVLGRPLAGMSPDWVEHDEWALRMSRPSQEEIGVGSFDRRPIDLANTMGQMMDYKWTTDAEQQIKASLERDKQKAAAAARRAARTKNDQGPKSQ